MGENVIDLSRFKEALSAKVQEEAEYFEHMDRIAALIDLLAPTIRSMRELGATDQEIAAVLRYAAGEFDGEIPL